MKTSTKNGTPRIKSGSVSFSEARRAAREAKIGRGTKPLAELSPAARADLEERYLGHFGPVVKKASAKKGAATRSKKAKSVAKQSAARKISHKLRGKSGRR